MLTPGAEQISGIDGSTMNVEDSFITKIVANSMDLRKIIAVIGSFYWIIMTIFIVPCAVVATFLTILLPIILIKYVFVIILFYFFFIHYSIKLVILPL